MKLRCNGFYDIQLVGVIFRLWKEYQTEDNSSFLREYYFFQLLPLWQ